MGDNWLRQVRYTVARVRSALPRFVSADCAAASRAIGTRNGEQET